MSHGEHGTPAKGDGSARLKPRGCRADLTEVQFRRVILAITALLVLSASGQAAGIVKYRSTDGEIGYASPGLVPEGATVETPNYEPDGRLSRRPRAAGEPLRTRKPVVPAKAAEPRGNEKVVTSKALIREKWAEKARAAQRELTSAELDYEAWKAQCPGVEDHSSNDELPSGCSVYDKSRFDAALENLEERRAWIEDGLFDACRLSGECLPGYIR